VVVFWGGGSAWGEKGKNFLGGKNREVHYAFSEHSRGERGELLTRGERLKRVRVINYLFNSLQLERRQKLRKQRQSMSYN